MVSAWLDRRLLICVGLFVVAATAHLLISPPYELPDEAGHTICARELTWSRALDQATFGPYVTQTNTGHHPPLYYLLTHPLAAAGGLRPEALKANPRFPQDPRFYASRGESVPGMMWLYLLRFLGLVMGLGVVALTFATARRMLPDHPGAVLVATALPATLPGFVHRSAAVSNDALTNLIAAAFTFLLVRAALDHRFQTRSALAIGALMGAGLLTKATLLFSLPIMALVPLLFWSSEWRKQALRYALVAIGAALLIGGWWYLRNQLLYGDLAARSLIVEHLATSDAIQEPFSVNYWLRIVGWQVVTFILRLGSYLLAPPWFYLVYLVLFIVPALAGVRALRSAGLTMPQSDRQRAWWLLAAVAITPVLLQWINQLSMYSPSGRLLMVGLVGIACAFGAGWRRFSASPNTAYGVLGALTLGSVFSVVWSAVYL